MLHKACVCAVLYLYIAQDVFGFWQIICVTLVLAVHLVLKDNISLFGGRLSVEQRVKKAGGIHMHFTHTRRVADMLRRCILTCTYNVSVTLAVLVGT